MSDNPVRVVAEDVFSIWGQRNRAVESCGKIGGEEGPDAGGADGLGAKGECAGVVSREEVEGDCVWNKEGPEKANCAEVDEKKDEDRYAETVPGDHCDFESASERILTSCWDSIRRVRIDGHFVVDLVICRDLLQQKAPGNSKYSYIQDGKAPTCKFKLYGVCMSFFGSSKPAPCIHQIHQFTNLSDLLSHLPPWFGGSPIGGVELTKI